MDKDNCFNDISDKTWDNFVFAHPKGNIFQTMALCRVYEETKNYSPIPVAVIDSQSQKIQGVLIGVIIREISGFLGDFSARSIIHGGPLVVSDSKKDITTELIQKYDSLVCRSALYTEIRNMFDIKEQLNPIDYYTHKDHLNFLINLKQPEEKLWSQIHKSRRKNINRAEKYNVIVEEMTNPEKIPIFYKLLLETYSNVKIPLADISLFKSAFQHLVPMGYAKFFLARQGDNYIGARAVLNYKDRIYDWYAGAAVNSLSFYPNECLVWHILKWGIKNNYSIFDFGGAGEPDKPYGPREFKRRFGGELVNYGRNVHNYSINKIRVAKFGFKIYQKLSL
ncbi:lipid II:glycine glycyltransferase FemX [Methanoregula formicica]|uniref:FemAB family n=1 Tax=Methanoregula formicica (strain DSM 22288 / NBRC 105244 / SMSP) TaxID=593750 RepID=L0HCG6_METFS|nr:GNAT family N-acetyltransferase [Methanoregula formicica]AGB02437.1 FemAB family [Methanoregula formicica SMSP]